MWLSCFNFPMLGSSRQGPPLQNSRASSCSIHSKSTHVFWRSPNCLGYSSTGETELSQALSLADKERLVGQERRSI